MKEMIITENESGQRIDRFLGKYMSKASKSFIQKMLRKKRIKINNKKIDSSYKLNIGDSIQIYFSEETINKFIDIKDLRLNNREIEIIYEDENLIIVNKEKNLLTHGSQNEDNLVDRVKTYLYNKGEYNPEAEKTFSPACCNRLDRNTTGLVIVAKNYDSLKKINNDIKNKKIQKHYLALVVGDMRSSTKIKGFIQKNSSTNKSKIVKTKSSHVKEVETIFTPLKGNGQYTLIGVDLITGRSHQIRAQLMDLGYPIVGDLKYGNKNTNRIFKKLYNINSQFLHAEKILLQNYNIKPLGIKAPLPKELNNIVTKLGLSI